MPPKNLSGWKKFKIWTSRHFGCASNYTVKHDENEEANVRRKKQRPFDETNNKSQTQIPADKTNNKQNGGVVDGSGTKPVENPAVNVQPLERTLSIESDDLPFIDASIINLPQAVKKQ